MRLLLSVVFVITTLLVCTPLMIASDIDGVVRDASSGETLRRASVFTTVQNKVRGVFSNAGGAYVLRSIPGGEYEVHCRFIGYKEKKIVGVRVVEGKNVHLDITLEPVQTTTQEVVVEARASRESDASILARRKAASELSDGVGATEIHRQSDPDAAQVLKRVSGVTVVADKFVYVRGISERYNNTTLNGTSLSSSETDKKAFAFDMFPSEFLQSASVLKSFSPDIPGNFAGGSVQLQTVDFPEATSLKVHLGASATDNLSFQSQAFNSYTGASLDWLGYDDGARMMPSVLPANRNEMNSILSAARAYYAGDTSSDKKAAADRWQSMAGAFNNGLWHRQTSTVYVLPSFGASYAQLFHPDDAEIGVLSSVSYSNQLSLQQLVRRGISSTSETLFDYQGSDWSRSTSVNALLNVSARMNHTVLSLRNLYNHVADDDLVDLFGNNVAQTRDLHLLSADYTERSLLSSQVIGEHAFGDDQQFKLDWRVGYSTSTKDQPDYRRLRYSRSSGTEEAYVADIPYPGSQSGDGTSAGHFSSALRDHVWTGGVNTEYLLDGLKLKAGMLMEDRSRDFATRSFTYIQSKIFTRGAVVADSVLMLSPDSIFQAENFGPNGLAISEDSKPSDSYTASEHLYAAFVMTEYATSVSGMKLRISGGVRVEDNTTDLNTVTKFSDGTNLPEESIQTHLHTTDLLPALNVVLSIQPSMNVRLALSRTLTRPSLREYAPFAFYDFQNLAIVQGNPNLTRTLIQNYDIRWEYFPESSEVLSAGLFFKRFDNAIEETIVPAASEIERTFANATAPATNYGVEIEARKSLSWISSSLDNFLLSLNYSWIHSRIEIQQGLVSDTRPLWGQSPYAFNAGLHWVGFDHALQSSLTFNVSGKRIVQVAQVGSFSFADPHVYEMPHGQLDFSLSYQVVESLQLKASVRDILNQPIEWQQGGVVVSSVQRGRSLSLTLSYVIL